MADLNAVALIGRLTRDAEMKYTSGGGCIANFSLAVNRRRKQGDGWTDEASFIDCTLFGNQAEAVSRYLTKGKQVGVVGELRQERWEKDGQKRSKVKIIADNVQLLGSASNGSGEGASTSAGAAAEDGVPF